LILPSFSATNNSKPGRGKRLGQCLASMKTSAAALVLAAFAIFLASFSAVVERLQAAVNRLIPNVEPI
jgi:hypothetical protein